MHRVEENLGAADITFSEGFFLHYSSRAQMPQKLRVFIDCLLKHARRDAQRS